MPSELDTVLGVFETWTTKTCNGQCSGWAMETAYESLPSSVCPAYQRVHPGGMLLAALPEPRRARQESCFCVKSRPAAVAAASAQAALPEADEARPEAYGKVL